LFQNHGDFVLQEKQPFWLKEAVAALDARKHEEAEVAREAHEREALAQEALTQGIEKLRPLVSPVCSHKKKAPAPSPKEAPPKKTPSSRHERSGHRSKRSGAQVPGPSRRRVWKTPWRRGSSPTSFRSTSATRQLRRSGFSNKPSSSWLKLYAAKVCTRAMMHS
jgi:hypothetical protein